VTLRTLLTVLASATVSTALALPASAASSTVVDARGDVWRAAGVTGAEPSPTTRHGDLTRTVVTYGRHHVKVKLRFVALRKKDAYAQYAVRLQGKQGKVVRTVLVETSRRDRHGVHRVFNAKDSRVECDAGHDVSYRKDRVTVTLDRRCLGSPKAVRVNVNTARATTTRKQDAVFYSDSGQDAAAESDTWSGWVKRG
jgi:hypothetical protein